MTLYGSCRFTALPPRLQPNAAWDRAAGPGSWTGQPSRAWGWAARTPAPTTRTVSVIAAGADRRGALW